MKLDWKKSENLIPAVIQDEKSGRVLMLGYMNEESLEQTQRTGLVTFFSRSRQKLWQKGETSGNTLRVVEMHPDCDQDALLIQVAPEGPVCHRETESCFDSSFEFLGELESIIAQRFKEESETSYVSRLKKSGLDRIAQKVGEEAIETVIAAKNDDLQALEGEVADLLFHTLVLLKSKGTSLTQILNVLRKRHQARCNTALMQ